MKRSTLLLLLLLTGAVFLPLTTVHAQEEVIRFHQKLNNIYEQKDDNTIPRQAAFGVIETIALFKLNSWIPRVDRIAMVDLKRQLKALNHKSNSEMSYEMRESRKRYLRRQMHLVEGNIMKKMGRGTARLLIRGTQLLLILDLATRLYVLNIIEKDPGFFPAYTVFCSETDCESAIENVMDIQTQSYDRLRESLRD